MISVIAVQCEQLEVIYLTVLCPLCQTCTATLQDPLAWATTLMSLNSAWNTRETKE